MAVGPPPLGYKSEILSGHKGERKVPDPDTMPVLLSLLQDYSTGDYSYRNVADRLNARGLRTVRGRPFREASVMDVLGNRFYDGKVVYHEGKDDELVTEGIHEVPRRSKTFGRDARRSNGPGTIRRQVTRGVPPITSPSPESLPVTTVAALTTGRRTETASDQPFDCPTSGGGLEDTVSLNLAPGRSMPWWTRWVIGSYLT